MKTNLTQKLLLGVIFLFTISFVYVPSLRNHSKHNSSADGIENENDELNGPNESFYAQRSYPDNDFAFNAYQKSLKEIQSLLNNKSNARTAASNGFDADWNLEGPGNTGGRLNAVAIDPNDNNIIYAGNATGGVFKTTDGGATWLPIFDAQSYLSIACIEFQPGNSNIIYVGTGDPNISGYAFIGDGVYRSTDAGATWTHLGLSAERIVSRIAINPVDTNIIYVATMGIPFVRTPDRGLYKSTDGGVTWNNILFINDSAGIIDLAMDFTDPNVLYAASWNRIRNNHESMFHGNDAKIWKTTNGGANWTELAGGLPTGDFSRISFTMSGMNHNTLYASYADDVAELYNLYKTTDGGNNWTTINTNGLNNPFNGQGWYSGGIKVNPWNDNELILCGVSLYKSTDGGSNWNRTGGFTLHSDMHDVEYSNSTTIYLTTDGGMYQTTNNGSNWNDIEEIPNNQFYHIACDPVNIGMYGGGVQDNGTNIGNGANINNWNQINGADGFQMLYHPTDPDILWAETQYGGIVVSTNGGGFFQDATNGINANEYHNWDMPYIMSISDPNLLYTGTTVMYKNTSGDNANWNAISPELVDASFTNDVMFHSISCIAESPVDVNNLYAGTTDGHVWTSPDAGNTWNEVTGTLPIRYVTNVKASRINASVAFVSHSGYKEDDYIPHIHKTTDNGATWTDISGDLPQIAVDCIMPTQWGDDILFVGTDAGVYATLNGGVNWLRVGNNFPVVPVYDLQYEPNNKLIVAASHGRSIWTYSMDSVLTSVGATNVANTVSMNVYPNPASDYLKLNVNRVLANTTVSILSANGDLIRKSEMKINKEIVIPVSALPSGVYFVKVSGSGINAIKRMVKL